MGTNKKLLETVITLNSRLLIGVFICRLKFQFHFFLLFGMLNILGLYKLFGQNEIENFFSVTNWVISFEEKQIYKRFPMQFDWWQNFLCLQVFFCVCEGERERNVILACIIKCTYVSMNITIVVVWSQFDGGKIDHRTIGLWNPAMVAWR